jgi:ABC-type transport system substrate-binding protein
MFQKHLNGKNVVIFYCERERKKRGKNMKNKNSILVLMSIAMLLLLSVPMIFSAPVSAVGTGGPLMDELLVKYYPDNPSLFDALVAGDIDIMAWPLVKSQYDVAKTNPNIQTAPYQELGMYEIDINNNKTMKDLPWPSPTADKSFRQALAFCVDKNTLVSSIVGGFGNRIDTPIARPILENWVAQPPDPLARSEYDAAGNEVFAYPYDYDPTQAPGLLTADGFVAGQTANPYYDAQLSWSSPTIRVYPATQVVWDYWHIADEPTGHELPSGLSVYEVMLEWAVEGDWHDPANLKVYYNGMMDNCYPFSCLLRPVIDYEVVGLLLIIHVNMLPPPPCVPDTVEPLPGCAAVFPPKESFKFYANYKVHHPKAGLDLDPLLAYVRSDHAPRKWAGESLVDHMRKLGIPVALTEGPSSVTRGPVMNQRKYHIYTGGWSMGAYPTHFYALYTELGIYWGGANYPQVEYPDHSYWAKVEYLSTRDPTFVEAIYAAKVCQAKLVDYAACVWLYSNTGYMAYKTGWLNVINFRGYGLERALFWTSMMCYNANPLIKQVKYGLMNPPNALNPIFSSWTWDYEVMDNIFGWLLLGNPYQPTKPGKSPGGGDLPYLAKDWSYWVKDPENEAHVDYKLSEDFTWHDGTPVTAYDVNYTIWLTVNQPDAWAVDAVADLKDVIVHGPYDIELVFNVPSVWAIYFFYPFILPKHIYEDILDPNGFTPGDLPEEQVLIGYGPWYYDSGDRVQYALLKAYRDFPLDPVRGDIDLNFFWDKPTPVFGNADSGTTTTTVDAERNEANNYWVGCEIKYLNGSNVGEMRDITAFSQATHTITHGAFAHPVAANDRYVIYCGGAYKVGLSDLVMVAKAYCGRGETASTEPPGHGPTANWEPGTDVAAPTCHTGLTDLVTVAKAYGIEWGRYDP